MTEIEEKIYESAKEELVKAVKAVYDSMILFKNTVNQILEKDSDIYSSEDNRITIE